MAKLHPATVVPALLVPALLVLALVVPAPCAAQVVPAATGTTPDAEAALRAKVTSIVEEHRQSSGARGMVVGILAGGQRCVFAFGESGRGENANLGGDTLFEIGSISKTFTSLLLAIAVEQHDVRLDDPVAALLPAGTVVPERGGKKITLIDLATHTSGLPRLPNNLLPEQPADPYADYGSVELYAFLARCNLRRDIGKGYEYSNLGAGLLGHALTVKADRSYEKSLQERICKPLGLEHTTTEPSAEQESEIAVPHLRFGARGIRWHFAALAGAGAICSTVNDMLTYGAAQVGARELPDVLAAAIRRSHVPLRPARAKQVRVALGWHVSTRADNALVHWHDGRTGGFASIMLFLADRKIVVVVLCNQSIELYQLGNELLELVAGPPGRGAAGGK